MSRLSLPQFKEWNPQLVREFKGRFQVRNILIAIGISILSQVILFFSTFDKFPGMEKITISSGYCTSKNQLYYKYEQQYWKIQDQLNDFYFTGDRSVLEQQLKTLEKLKNSYCPQDLIDFNRWFTDYWANIFIWISVLYFLDFGFNISPISSTTNPTGLGAISTGTEKTLVDGFRKGFNLG
ncbi:hypothetical protein PA905_47230 [Planktothrix agardhii CCAP 1459/11A]|uniref:Uncharacterized protein n=1 Tax=Planktothrix agardhii CCAP 1459/11A TaxID=282420 RepID=A0A4P5ZM41_PLAAG|nr:hypothetical protein [Planktothrix agardhii]GDZ96234.1 hypothetical protein PA905_47230 [Planktothrix agardhii CCAP 1459/11A]